MWEKQKKRNKLRGNVSRSTHPEVYGMLIRLLIVAHCHMIGILMKKARGCYDFIEFWLTQKKKNKNKVRYRSSPLPKKCAWASKNEQVLLLFALFYYWEKKNPWENNRAWVQTIISKCFSHDKLGKLISIAVNVAFIPDYSIRYTELNITLYKN